MKGRSGQCPALAVPGGMAEGGARLLHGLEHPPPSEGLPGRGQHDLPAPEQDRRPLRALRRLRRGDADERVLQARRRAPPARGSGRRPAEAEGGSAAGSRAAGRRNGFLAPSTGRGDSRRRSRSFAAPSRSPAGSGSCSTAGGAGAAGLPPASLGRVPGTTLSQAATSVPAATIPAMRATPLRGARAAASGRSRLPRARLTPPIVLRWRPDAGFGRAPARTPR